LKSSIVGREWLLSLSTAAPADQIDHIVEAGFKAIIKGESPSFIEYVEIHAKISDPTVLYIFWHSHKICQMKPKEPGRALTLFRTAANLNGEFGQLMLYTSCYSGNGVPKDFETAALWYAKAAEHGNITAHRKLGECIQWAATSRGSSGRPLLTTPSGGKRRRHAGKRDLPYIHRAGVGTKKDDAFKCCALAANKVDKLAQRILGFNLRSL
jgi:hypothetical protein